MGADLVHEHARDGLDDEVDMHGHPAGMRPEAHVDLLGTCQLGDYRSGPPEQRAELEKQLGEDVAGFQLQSAYMTEKLAGFHQAALLQEAEQARMVRMASTGKAPSSGEQSGLQNVITGVWRSLTALRTAPS